ncbi:uncharacterized protein LOC133381448, partial [Rhineura floridana]|uniref:uncharacterized protein LOC133381448 n=1 Tax=Rhineura floridana TaxID=261503 RepID=UPI002AC87C9B
MDDANLNMDYIEGKLLQEFQRRQEMTKQEKTESKHNVEKQNNKAAQERLYGQKACYFCGSKQHLQRNCEARRRERGRKPCVQVIYASKNKQCINNEQGNNCKDLWAIDSGATNSIIKDKSLFHTFCDVEDHVIMADGTKKLIKSRGTVKLAGFNTIMTDVLFVPDIECNIMAVSKLNEMGFTVMFKRGSVHVMRGEKIFMKGLVKKSLFYMQLRVLSTDTDRTHRGSIGINLTQSVKAQTPVIDADVVANKTEQEKEPSSLGDIKQLPIAEQNEWHAAMKEELEAMRKNGTWTLVPLPPGKKAIGCKWIFKRKRSSTGQIQRYRARLVAKGFTQQFGTDYDTVFAPVVKHESIRVLLKIAAIENMHVSHYDIGTAFLHGELKEEIYMEQPPGCETQPGLVCKLQKSLYGLRQSARCSNEKLDDVLQSMNFKRCVADPCVYVKETKGGLTYCLVYVDD